MTGTVSIKNLDAASVANRGDVIPATQTDNATRGLTVQMIVEAAFGAAGPAALGEEGDPGSADEAARADHVHPRPSPADIGAAAGDHAHDTYDICGGSPGKPLAEGVVLLHVFARAARLPAGLAGSQCKTLAAATAEAVFTLRRITVADVSSDIGTITIAAGTKTAGFALAAVVDFAAGDVLTAVAPATQDATLADVAITLKGVRL